MVTRPSRKNRPRGLRPKKENNVTPEMSYARNALRLPDVPNNDFYYGCTTNDKYEVHVCVRIVSKAAATERRAFEGRLRAARATVVEHVHYPTSQDE